MAFDREARPARPNRGKRRKVCQFCAEKCEHIDYKDAAKLRRFISERAKILPRRNTGPLFRRRAGLFFAPDENLEKRACFFSAAWL